MKWLNRLPWTWGSLDTLAPAVARRTKATAAPRRQGVVLRLEQLESREVFATFAVNTLVDDANSHDVNPGDGVALDANGNASLRAAIEESNALAGADDITLPSSVSGQTITLTQGELLVTDDVTIGPAGAGELSILSGGGTQRVFNVGPSGRLTLNDLTVQDGHVGTDGGGLYVEGVAILNGVALLNNQAAGDGGGVFVADGGELQATNLYASGNAALGEGGAVAIGQGGTGEISSSVVAGNTAADGGGLAEQPGGDLLVFSSSVFGNTATDPGGDPDVSEEGGHVGVPNNPVAPITGTVWYDLDGDGVRDPDEPVAAGVPVYLLRDGAIVGSTVTDADGVYVFDAPIYDTIHETNFTYQILVDSLGNVFTGQNVGDDATDSDVDGGGLSGPITFIVEGGGFGYVDAGLIPVTPPDDGPDEVPFNLPPFFLVPGTNNVNPLAAPFYTQPELALPFVSRGGDRIGAYVHVYKVEQVGAQSIVKRVLTMPMSTTDPTEIQGLLGTVPPGKYRITLEARQAELTVWEGLLPAGQLAIRQGIDKVLKAIQSQADSQEALRELLPTAAPGSDVAQDQKAERLRRWFDGPSAPPTGSESNVVPEVPPRAASKPAPPTGGESTIPQE